MSDDTTTDSGDGAASTHGRPVRRTAAPKKNAPRKKKQRGLFFKVAVGTVLGLLTLVLLVIAALVVIYFKTDIPPANADATKQVSIAYYDDGKTEIGRLGSVNRSPITLDKVPLQTQQAFLAAEDRDFYQNNGISPTGIVRALWNNVRGGGIQGGGSTITQQYVKNYFLTQDQSMSRKLREAMIAIKIDQKYSKQQVLEDYLNNVYFGRGAYGIQAGAQAYFGVDAQKLSLNQGIFLASVINAPGLFDPAISQANLARAQTRSTYVADGMVTKGWMTADQRSSLTMPSFPDIKRKSSVTGTNGYLVNAIRKELTGTLKLTDNDIDRGGLRIVTTINKKDQEAAVAAVDKVVPDDVRNLDRIHTGLVAQKPDGGVVAMYAGVDPQTEASNTQYQYLQGGSSFKVFGLTAALKQGMNLQDTYYDGPARLRVAPGKDGVISNFDYESFGNINLVTALAHSVNTVFVQLNKDLGTDYKATLQSAQDLGIPATDPGMLDTKTPATYVNNILGSPSVRVADMANAYNTINNGGVRADQHFITKVTSESGAYNYDFKAPDDRVITTDQASTLTQAMSHVLTDRGATGTVANRILGRPAAGKTGTTNENKAVWFTGYTPGQLTTSVGMFSLASDGKTPRQMTFNGLPATGGAVPTQVWGYFMKAALANQPVAKLPTPSGDNTPTRTRQPTTTPPAPTTTQQPTTTTTTSEPPTPTSTSTTPTPTSTTTSTPEPTTSQPESARPTATQPTATRPNSSRPETPPPAQESPPNSPLDATS